MTEKQDFLSSITLLSDDLDFKIKEADEAVAQATKRLTWEDSLLTDDMLKDLPDNVLRSVLPDEDYERIVGLRVDIIDELGARKELEKSSDYVDLSILSDESLENESQEDETLENESLEDELLEDESLENESLEDKSLNDESLDNESLEIELPNKLLNKYVIGGILVVLVLAIIGIYFTLN